MGNSMVKRKRIRQRDVSVLPPDSLLQLFPWILFLFSAIVTTDEPAASSGSFMGVLPSDSLQTPVVSFWLSYSVSHFHIP